MAHGRVHLSGDEMIKFRTIKDILEGKVSQKEGSEKLRLSTRQVRRLQKRVKEKGVDGIIHGLVGRPSNNALKSETIEKIRELWSTKYKKADFNFSHFTEKLNEVEGIKVSLESVRSILRSCELTDKKLKNRRKHRKKRPRRERFGELLQQDTSPHDWLGTGEKLNLIAVIDDATSTALYAQLFKHDGTLPNMTAMKSVFSQYGLPMAIYVDRASWFHYSFSSEHAKRRAHQEDYQTQIGRSLEELGIEFIPAYSSQAKGRIERMNRTFQDRLISELRLRNITNMELANQFIRNVYLNDHNTRFAVQPQDPDSAFVALVNQYCLDQVLCQKFTSKVRNDNVVSKKRYYELQLLPTKNRSSWVKARVEVRIHIGGHVTVLHEKTKEIIPHQIITLGKAREPKHGMPLELRN